MYILPAHLVVVKDIRFTPPQLLGEQEQIIKVDAVIGAQQLLIDLVDACRYLFDVFCRLLGHLLRPQQIILCARDQRLYRGRLILLLIQVQIFHRLFNQRGLLIGIKDDERLVEPKGSKMIRFNT